METNAQTVHKDFVTVTKEVKQTRANAWTLQLKQDALILFHVVGRHTRTQHTQLIHD